MKFLKVMSNLLNEGRKEDLQKKYSNKFKEYGETLSTILSSSDLADTNSSYGNASDLNVEVGDIVLVVTDGVLDNISTDELAQLVSESYENYSQKHPQRELAHLISRDVAFEARKLSEDELRDSPFSAEAKKRGLNHLGGKEDDITVVTAVILPKTAQ